MEEDGLKEEEKVRRRGCYTGQVTDEDFACSHLVEVAHINTISWKCLCIEHR